MIDIHKHPLLIDVEITPYDELANRNRLSTKTYEEIFEQEGKWENGKDILLRVVNDIKNSDITLDFEDNTLKFITSFTLEDHWSRVLDRPKTDLATDIIQNSFREYLGPDFFDYFRKQIYSEISDQFLAISNKMLEDHKLYRQRKDYPMLWEIVLRDFGLADLYTKRGIL
jgi:hypothetical protein